MPQARWIQGKMKLDGPAQWSVGPCSRSAARWSMREATRRLGGWHCREG